MSANLNKAALPVVGDGAATVSETVGTTAVTQSLAAFGGKLVRVRSAGGILYLSGGYGVPGTDFAVATAANGTEVPDGDERDFFIPESLSRPGRLYQWSVVSDGAGRNMKITKVSQ